MDYDSLLDEPLSLELPESLLEPESCEDELPESLLDPESCDDELPESLLEPESFDDELSELEPLSELLLLSSLEPLSELSLLSLSFDFCSVLSFELSSLLLPLSPLPPEQAANANDSVKKPANSFLIKENTSLNFNTHCPLEITFK